jgi:two-component system CheB/CheR fusion protein
MAEPDRGGTATNHPGREEPREIAISSGVVARARERAHAPRIVGIGASAGGLAALEQFLAAVPADTRMAYVVVQHLDPTQKALLPTLLQRVTSMPVREVVQEMRIEPDSVYVIQPNTELSVVAGTLRVATPVEPRGMRLPINVLFSSLAQGEGERAIAVILSGMGSDGTLGLHAVKAVGGLTVVQEPATAQFDAMPKSAIAAGCADIVGPPGELPARIMDCVARVQEQRTAVSAAVQLPRASAPMQRVVELLKRATRHDFSLHKPSTLNRRIERRMAIHGMASLDLYADFLAQNPQEVELLFKELLIGVTSFFRDPGVWDYLADVVLPEMLAQRAGATHLRAWSIGCSTGEEAYSLAMVFSEAMQHLPPSHGMSLQIFASDLSPDAIATARRGHYPLAVSANVSPARLARFFTLDESGYQINKSIRDTVLFAQHDVVLDPPFTKLDLIVCRNLLIYFDQILQRRLLPLLHYSLRPGGILLLGSSETIGRLDHLFAPIEPRLRLYLRQHNAASDGQQLVAGSFPPMTRPTQEYPMVPPEHSTEPGDTLQMAADRLMLQSYAPAAVIVSGAGDIVYISGSTGKYLEPAAGKANWNFYAMVREGLRAPLAKGLEQILGRTDALTLRGLQVATPAGAERVDVTLQALHEPPALRGMAIVVFRQTSIPARRGRQRGQDVPDAAAGEEVERYEDEIRVLREEARSTREAVQAANEELQSTNEELQSANEELTTSREEMQSMNEELQTINAELQTKLDDLVLAQSDMKNLLNSTEIAILFLDQDLNVRRFTDRASRIINLRESDVGRPLSDLTSSLQYPELHADALATLQSLKVSEKQIHTDDGRWFTVRIMPYRRLDNAIDGIVTTFVDISEIKKLELALQDSSRH